MTRFSYFIYCVEAIAIAAVCAVEERLIFFGIADAVEIASMTQTAIMSAVLIVICFFLRRDTSLAFVLLALPWMVVIGSDFYHAPAIVIAGQLLLSVIPTPPEAITAFISIALANVMVVAMWLRPQTRVSFSLLCFSYAIMFMFLHNASYGLSVYGNIISTIFLVTAFIFLRSDAVRPVP